MSFSLYALIRAMVHGRAAADRFYRNGSAGAYGPESRSDRAAANGGRALISVSAFRGAAALCALAGAPWLLAQSTAKRTADEDWQALSSQVSRPVVASRAGDSETKGNSVTKATDADVTAQLKQVAQSAKAFQTAYPGDARVPQAKKIEAVALLKAVRTTDSDRGSAAFQTASVYRTDPKNTIADRFEVAALMERQQYSVQAAGKPLAKDSIQHEKVADKLRAEFGDTLEVHAFYLGVVNSADTETAYRVAQKVQQLPVAAFTKAEAQVTIDRHALIGQKLDQKFTDTSGQPFALSESGKVTIVYVWSQGAGLSPFKALDKYKAVLPSDARWVYVAVNSPSTVVEASRKLAPYPGIHSNELPLSSGPLHQALKIRRSPFVYVLGKDGKMVGYGDLDDLPALIAVAKK